MKKLFNIAASGIIGTMLLTSPAFAGDTAPVTQDNNATPQVQLVDPQLTQTGPNVTRTAMTEIQAGISFYSNILETIDENHFNGKITANHAEMAKAAMEAILLNVYVDQFYDPVTQKFDESAVEFVDGSDKREIKSLTLGAHTITLEDPAVPLNSYEDQARYLQTTIQTIMAETGMSAKELFEAAVNGAIHESRDPHTLYFGPEQMAEMNRMTSGEFVGIGISYHLKDGFIEIIEPKAGGPAEKAGLQKGDIVTAIDGESVKGKTTQEVSQAIGGDEGTEVTLTVKRGNEKPFDLKVERAVIEVDAVVGKLIGENKDVMWLQVNTFSQKTANDLVDTMKDLMQQAQNDNHGVKSIVLDVRNNPGGLLPQALALSDIFIQNEDTTPPTQDQNLVEQLVAAINGAPNAGLTQDQFKTVEENLAKFYKDLEVPPTDKGRAIVEKVIDTLKDPAAPALTLSAAEFQIVQTQLSALYWYLDDDQPDPILGVGKTAKDLQYFADQIVNLDLSGNVIVLQNQGSASASEIVAGALKDAGHTVVGRRSYGKGSVQTLYGVDDEGHITNDPAKVKGLLKLTTAAFFPGKTGLSNQGTGIIPNVKVVYNDVRDKAAENARREADQDHALLSTEKTRAGNQPSYICTVKPEYAGPLSDTTVAKLPPELVTEVSIKDEQTGDWKKVKMLDADLAAALHVINGSSEYTTLEEAPQAPANNNAPTTPDPAGYTQAQASRIYQPHP